MILKFKVAPKSSKNKISWYDPEKTVLKLNLSAPAVEGKANKMLVEYLAKFFQVGKDSVEIQSGETAKLKLVNIEAAADWIARKLEEIK